MRRAAARLCWRGAFVVLVAAPSMSLAQVGGPYDLRWNTFDGGGITFATGGTYRLGGSIGQFDAGRMSGGNLTLSGGFWQGGQPTMAVDEETPADPDGAGGGDRLVFRLHPATPNPGSPPSEIRFDLPEPAPVRLAVYNLQGARVSVLADCTLPAGRHQVLWNGLDRSGNPVASGAYMILLEAGAFRAENKIVLLH